MKILKVSICNLNSLKGDHVVEFGKDPLASAGLFAITGPTGSGKTTILDAITLALFGKAARYGNEPSPEDMMTRGAIDCSAEVTFEGKKGTFVAQWSLARARGKIDGKIQNARRSIMTEAGKILAEQVKDVNSKIENLLGLDHDRFMRSVMLAQGQFAKFLTAKPDERAQLLESLTGSDIYSRIGALAFEEAGKIEQGILDRDKKIKAIVLLKDDQKAEIKGDIDRLEAQKKEAKEELNGLAAQKAKIVQLEKAGRDVETQTERLAAAEYKLASGAKDFKALASHQETIQFTELLTRIDREDEALEAARAAFSDEGDGLAEAKETLSQAVADYKAAIKLGLKNAQNAIKESEAEKKAADKRVYAAGIWLDAHKQDAQLATKLAQFSKLITARKSARSRLLEAWDGWLEQVDALEAKPGIKIPTDVAAFDDVGLGRHVQLVKDAAKTTHDAALAVLAAAKKALLEAQQAKQAALLLQKYEQDRASLKDGEPCSLCGAIHHPFAGKDLKASSAARFDKDIETAQTSIARADKGVIAAAALVQSVNQSSKVLTIAHSRALEQEKECAKQLKSAGFDGADDTDALQNRATEYTAKKEEQADSMGEVKQAQAEINAATKELVELQKRESTGVALPEGVKSSTGGAEEVELDDAESAFDDALSECKEANTLYAAATRSLKSAEAAQKKASAALEQKLEKSNFRSAKALREARLANKEAERITKAKDAVEKEINEAKLLLQEAKRSAASLVKEGIPRGAAAKKVKDRHSELVDLMSEITESVTRKRVEISTDEANRKEQKRLLDEIEEEMKEVGVWRKLRELIGSKDGAKFRKFAQSITLQILTSHANKHLGRLNDRYALLLQEGDTLELQIEDYYQARIKRPLASLSGGESFLASLALALGLSDLAGRSVNIDTLFIDEGFGTLDPETLEVALTALETLRQGNKSVGVISHVGLLKERITIQVVVTKGASGHSNLKVIS